MTSIEINVQRARIFRITHRSNVPWILENGVHCRNAGTADSKFVTIGNPELIDKRHYRSVPSPHGGTLSDYVPFYFTPFSPMMYNIKTGYAGIRKRENEEIVILVSSIPRLIEKQVPFVFTDRHANLAAAQFHSDPARLDQIDWSILQNRDFKRDANDMGKVERYQAEALVYKHMPVDALLGIVCYSTDEEASLKRLISDRGLAVATAARSNWYFR